MKTKTVMLYITLLASCYTVSAQNPINVIVTGTCAILSGTYSYNGLQNGKNRYVKQFELQNTIFNVYVRYDGTYWFLNNSEDIDEELLFYNTNTTGVCTTK